MALSPQPDIRFFRNTGLALVTATLAAGAITLSLTLAERSSIALVRSAEAQTESRTEIVGSVVAAPIDKASQGYKEISEFLNF